MYGLFCMLKFSPLTKRAVSSYTSSSMQGRFFWFFFFFPYIEFKKQALNDPKDIHTAFSHSGAYKQIP